MAETVSSIKKNKQRQTSEASIGHQNAKACAGSQTYQVD